MKLGDDRGALAFASKKSSHQAFGLASSASAWLWSVALLDFRYKRQRGFAKEYYQHVHKFGSVFPPPGAIMCASQASYHVLSFLTGERKLPNCKIPFVMRSENSLSNAAVYCTSNLELWRSTPGAIEWAAKNCHTHYCFLLLRKEKEILDFLKFKQTLSTFKSFVKKGIFLDSSLPGFEGGLVTEAVKANMVDQLEVLLKAGAKTVVRHGRCAPQALHMACYYDHDPKIIKLLCRYGKPVTVIFTVTMASCLEALKFVHNLETSKRLQLLLQYYYCKFMLHDFKYIFFGRHKIYLFVKAFVRELC